MRTRHGKNPYDRLYDRHGKTASTKSREKSRYGMHPIRPTEDHNFDWEVRFDGEPIAWFTDTVECSEFIHRHISENNPPAPIDKDRD